jgi:hypothetical protein
MSEARSDFSPQSRWLRGEEMKVVAAPVVNHVPAAHRPTISSADPGISRNSGRLLGWASAHATLERMNNVTSLRWTL